MKISVEPYGTRMGDNTITEALKYQVFGLRFDLTSDDYKSRNTFILDELEVDELLRKIMQSEQDLDELKERTSGTY